MKTMTTVAVLPIETMAVIHSIETWIALLSYGTMRRMATMETDHDNNFHRNHVNSALL
jgi:hypothetical protein